MTTTMALLNGKVQTAKAMPRVQMLDAGISRFQPLSHIICYDDFDKGMCGWMDLHPNYVGKDFNLLRHSQIEKTQWGPIMLSSASYRLAGTHGSMIGTYSL